MHNRIISPLTDEVREFLERVTTAFGPELAEVAERFLRERRQAQPELPAKS